MAHSGNKNIFYQPGKNKQQHPDKYDSPIQNDEAQDVTQSANRLSGEEAEHSRNKANEGTKQGKNE